MRATGLKMQTSQETLDIAQDPLQVCNMAGYSEAGKLSVARVMIGNDRLNTSNSELIPLGGQAIF